MSTQDIAGLLDQAIEDLGGYVEERVAAGAEEPAALRGARERMEQAREELQGPDWIAPETPTMAGIITALGGMVSHYAALPQTYVTSLAIERVSGAITELARMLPLLSTTGVEGTASVPEPKAAPAEEGV